MIGSTNGLLNERTNAWLDGLMGEWMYWQNGDLRNGPRAYS